MTLDQTLLSGNELTHIAPPHITQAYFDEWVISSGVSEAISQLNLESLDDTRVIARLASQSTSAISEVL